MRGSAFWLGVTLVVAVLLWPLLAGAQGRRPARAQDEVAQTDRRIELAESLVPRDLSPALGELALARETQARARAALGAGRFGLAQRTTLAARSHADRAIAAVRGLPDPERVLQHLERTSELADWARDRLAGCTEARAHVLLVIGQEMQERAGVAAREGRFLAALQLTNNARGRIQRALSLCNVTESLQETAERSLQKTDDLLARARTVVESHPPDEAGRDLQHALAVQSDAHAAFGARQYEFSVRLTLDARMTAHRILRAPAPGGGSVPGSPGLPGPSRRR
jgi:hypothetical protein